jgi:hypothetical protein
VFQLRGIAIALLTGALLASGSVAYAQSASSPDVKAAFLFNFAKFIAWPAGQLPDGQPIIIGIIGQASVADSLAGLVRGKTIEGHALQINFFPDADNVTRVHMLFIGEAARGRIADLVKRIGKDSVVTVSDAPRFCAMGGIIQLRIEDDRIRFDINLQQAGLSGLVINSKLLALAGIVNPGKTH